MMLEVSVAFEVEVESVAELLFVDVELHFVSATIQIKLKSVKAIFFILYFLILLKMRNLLIYTKNIFLISERIQKISFQFFILKFCHLLLTNITASKTINNMFFYFRLQVVVIIYK